MKILFDGVKEFSKYDFNKNRELFEKLSDAQQPHTLFIGCSDSRVVPDMITRSNPGDLFVVRNIANVVPYYRKSTEYLSTTSAIEYAILVLKVKNIIVCGHSNCGGCKALYFKESELEKIPHVNKWLELIKTSKQKVEAAIQKPNANIDWLIEQQNIIEQMNHLISYPFVEEYYNNGLLNIYGWYYEIGTGSVYNYNPKESIFEKIE